MKIAYKIIVFITFFSVTLLADCELVEDEKYKSYQEFKEAEDLHDNLEYAKAYEMLLQSLSTYTYSDNEIELVYECVNYVPGPYAPIINKSTKTESFDFNRRSLGKNIKNQLSPAPYVFIEFQKNRTIVSATNAEKTPRGKLKGRLPLENFIVTIDNEKFNFGTLRSAEVKKVSSNNRYTPNSTIVTKEDFGFKLYK